MVDELFDVETSNESDQAPSLVLRVHASPGAGRSAVVGRHAHALAVRVASRPDKERANESCREVVAELFDVTLDAVTVVSGEQHRDKALRVVGVSDDEARRRLERAIDESEGAFSARLGRRRSR